MIGVAGDMTAKIGVPLTGSGGLTTIGAGTLILSGTDTTYSGATTVNEGTLQAGATDAFSPNSDFAVNAALNLNGYSQAVGALSGAGTIIGTNTTNSAYYGGGGTNPVLTVGADNDSATFSGRLQDGNNGTLSLVKVGSGDETLSGVNNYSGGTTIDGGTLSLGNAQALGNGGGLLTINNYGVLDLAGYSATVGGLSDGGGGDSTGVVTNSVGAGDVEYFYVGGGLCLLRHDNRRRRYCRLGHFGQRSREPCQRQQRLFWRHDDRRHSHACRGAGLGIIGHAVGDGRHRFCERERRIEFLLWRWHAL